MTFFFPRILPRKKGEKLLVHLSFTKVQTIKTRKPLDGGGSRAQALVSGRPPPAEQARRHTQRHHDRVEYCPSVGIEISEQSLGDLVVELGGTPPALLLWWWRCRRRRSGSSLVLYRHVGHDGVDAGDDGDKRLLLFPLCHPDSNGERSFSFFPIVFQLRQTGCCQKASG